MKVLIDTNVVAEWVKPRPEPRVVAWLADLDEDRTYLSVATLAEIGRGIESLAAGRRRDRLSVWLADELPTRFDRRILTIDAAVAGSWGRIMVRSRHHGVTMGSMDAWIAATADVHGLTLATRNVRDFSAAGIDLIDPWS